MQFNSFNFWSIGIVEFPSEEEEDEEDEELHIRVAGEHEEAMEFAGRGGQAILPPLLIPSSPPPTVRRVPSAALSAETAAVAAANAAAAAAVAIEVATWDARTASSSFLEDSRNSSSGSTPPHLASPAAAHPAVTASPSVSGEVSSSGELIDESQIEEGEGEQRWMETLLLTNEGVSSVYSKPVSSVPSGELSSSSIARRQVLAPPFSDVDSSRYGMNMAGINGDGINGKTLTVTEEEVESVEAAALTAAFTAALDEPEKKTKTAARQSEAKEEEEKKRQVNPDPSEPACDESAQATHIHEQDVNTPRPASALSPGREKEEKTSTQQERRGDRDGGNVVVGGLPGQEDISGEIRLQDGREGSNSPALLHHIDNRPLPLRSMVSPVDEEEERKTSEKAKTTNEEQEKVIIQPRRRWFFRDSFRRFGEPSSTTPSTCTETTSPSSTQLFSHSQPSGRRLSETSEVVECRDDHQLRSRQGHRSFPDTRGLLAYQEKNQNKKEKERNSRPRSYSSVERSGRGSSKGHLQNSLEALSDDDGSNSRKTSPQSKARQAMCGSDPAAEDDAAEFDGAGVCSAFWRKKAHGEPSPEKEPPIFGDSELNDQGDTTRNCPVDAGSASSLPISTELSTSQSHSQPLVPAQIGTTREREDAAVGNVCTAVTASARDGMNSISSHAAEDSYKAKKTLGGNVSLTLENEGEAPSGSSQPVSKRGDECRVVEGEKKSSELNTVEKGLEKTSRRHLFSRLLWRREVWTPNPSQSAPPPEPGIRPSSSFFSWSPAVAAPSSSSSTAATVDGTAEESSGCLSAPPVATLFPCPAVRSASCSDLKECQVPSAPSSPLHAAEGQEVYPGRRRKVNSCGSLAKRMDCTKERQADSAGRLHEEPSKCDSQNPSCETGANSPSYFLCEEADPDQAPAGSVAVETADPPSRGLTPSCRGEDTRLPRRTDRYQDECDCEATRGGDGNDGNQGIVAEDERTARCSPLTSSRSSSVDPGHLRTQESFRSLDEGAGGDKHHTETET